MAIDSMLVLGAALIPVAGTLTGILLTQRRDDRRDKERAEREDGREKEKAERQTRERMGEMRRVECEKLFKSARLLFASPPEAQAMDALNNAEVALLFLGDQDLAQAARTLATASRAMYHNQPGGSLDEYQLASESFIQVARRSSLN